MYSPWLTYLLLFIAVIGFLSNILVSVTIVKVKLLQDITHYLILNLAISDGLCCFMLGLEMFTHLLTYPDNGTSEFAQRLYCRLIYGHYMFQSFAYISAYNLVLISFERYISIVTPFRYDSMCTPVKVGLAVFIAWVLGFCMYTIHLIGVRYYPSGEVLWDRCKLEHDWEWHFVPFVLGFILPLLSMIWSYTHIIKALKQSTEDQQHGSLQAQESREATKRVVHLMLIVSVTYAILYIPTQPAYMVIVTINTGYFEFSVLGLLLTDLTSKLPVLLNSSVNPFIYAFKYKKFRKAVRQIVCRCDPNAVTPGTPPVCCTSPSA